MNMLESQFKKAHLQGTSEERRKSSSEVAMRAAPKIPSTGWTMNKTKIIMMTRGRKLRLIDKATEFWAVATEIRDVGN